MFTAEPTYLPPQFYKIRDEVLAASTKCKYQYLCENPHPSAILEITQLLERDPASANEAGLNWERISLNPSARQLIIDYPEKIDWYYASANPCALDIIPKLQLKGLNWFQLAYNTSPEAIRLLEENPSKICGYAIAGNPSAISIILRYYKKHPIRLPRIRFEHLAANPHPEIIGHISQEMDEFLQFADEEERITFWEQLSRNPSEEAAKILEKNIDQITWYSFSRHSNPTALRIIAANMDKVCMYGLSKNPSIEAMRLFLGADGCHERVQIYKNPNIYTYNYDAMRRDALHAALREEFMAWYWSPSRVSKYLENGGDIENIEVEL